MAGGRQGFARAELLFKPSLKARLEGRAQAEGRSLGEGGDVLVIPLGPGS
jgi:hypothetical protein